VPRGGLRSPSGGRPRGSGEGTVTTSIVVRPSLLAELERIAGPFDRERPRSAWIVEAIKERLGTLQSPISPPLDHPPEPDPQQHRRPDQDDA